MITSDNLDIAGRSRPHERTRILRRRLVPSLLVFLIVGVATSGCSLTAPSSRLSLSEAHQLTAVEALVMTEYHMRAT